MAAEYALVHLGEMTSVTETPPPPVLASRPSTSDDFSADIVLPTEMKSSLLYDFSQAEDCDPDCDPADQDHQETAAAADKLVTDGSDDDLPEELRGWDGDNLLSQLIGKNPLTIIGEMQIDASFLLLATSEDPLHPMFAMAAIVDGESFRAAGNSKKLAKARAAREALQKLYNLEFGISESKCNRKVSFTVSVCKRRNIYDLMLIKNSNKNCHLANRFDITLSFNICVVNYEIHVLTSIADIVYVSLFQLENKISM